jgi:hypothetical protein
MRSPQLEAALVKNRKRLALERLRAEASWVLDSIQQTAAAGVSRELDLVIRRELAVRRPRADGYLLVTREQSQFENEMRSFFAVRSTTDFSVFLCHWSDAGALELRGDTLAHLSLNLLLFDGDAVYGCDAARSEVFSIDRTIETDDRVLWEFFHFMTPAPLQG